MSRSARNTRAHNVGPRPPYTHGASPPLPPFNASPQHCQLSAPQHKLKKHESPTSPLLSSLPSVCLPHPTAPFSTSPRPCPHHIRPPGPCTTSKKKSPSLHYHPSYALLACSGVNLTPPTPPTRPADHLCDTPCERPPRCQPQCPQTANSPGCSHPPRSLHTATTAPPNPRLQSLIP